MQTTVDKQKKIITPLIEILSATDTDDYLNNPEKRDRAKELGRDIDMLANKLYLLSDGGDRDRGKVL
ncbi:MAG TPA: hypothetical protein ENK47_05645 [Euryarchaeota archaeon]|nr:hypothetical protein [Euryarchaeota archaeon]